MMRWPLWNLVVGAMLALTSHASLFGAFFTPKPHTMSRASRAMYEIVDRFLDKPLFPHQQVDPEEEAAVAAVATARAAAEAAATARATAAATAAVAAQRTIARHLYALRVLDHSTDRGIPLVILKTNFGTVYVTDSAGYVAFYEPGLMTGEPLWVTITSYGYKSPDTSFGPTDRPLEYRGKQIRPRRGARERIYILREQIAERLYRMTGYGIYRDSQMLGVDTPIRRPVNNAELSVSVSIECARFKGKLLWLWEGVSTLGFPLNNFAVTGATTALPEQLNPERGLDFDYYTTEDGPNRFPRPMIRLPLEQNGRVVVQGLTVIADSAGTERLIAKYSVLDTTMTCVERGLVLWNEATDTFDQRLAVLSDPRNRLDPAPSRHAIYVTDRGVRYVYYGINVRVRADFDSARDPSQYESFTCLDRGSNRASRQPRGEDDKDDKGGGGAPLNWRWEKGTMPVSFDSVGKLVQDGILQPHESPYELLDVETGRHVVANRMSIAWNPFLSLWVGILQQRMGDTLAGEIWFSTARAPEGPWKYARKIATHRMPDNCHLWSQNELNNPAQHHELMGEGGRFVYFSGTLGNTLLGLPWSEPYYSHNSIMHRLDLTDERLQLPSPPPGLWTTEPSE